MLYEYFSGATEIDLVILGVPPVVDLGLGDRGKGGKRPSDDGIIRSQPW